MDKENEGIRIKLRKVELTLSVATNGMFPKFVEIDFDANKYKVFHSPDGLSSYPSGTMVYEPTEYYPYVFNQFFYSKKDKSTRLFYVTNPEEGSVTWGDYVVRFGTPIEFGY
ncbi:MAG: hypothetical protein WC965_02070 [Thiohalomonadaceae bacterium]